MNPVFEPELAGLYVHWPFCAALCPYCDFAVFVRREPPFDAYADALVRSFERIDDAMWRTVYFGGGTPSLVPVEILARFAERIGRDSVQEWTLEANPDDVNAASLLAWREMGVTRLSMGVQSFDARYLQELSRRHTGATARGAVEMAIGAGFEVSIDLIFNGPRFDLSVFQTDVDLADLLGVHHVSSYELTVEPNTVFAKRAARGKLLLADETQMIADYHGTLAILGASGFERYEVSSFARNQAYGLHNSSYWLGQPYEGLGVGAHGLRQTDSGWIRTSNERDLRAFLGGTAQVTTEVVQPNEHLLELAFLGMRTCFGFGLASGHRIGADATLLSGLESILDRCVDRGWAVRTGDEFKPTELGLLMSNDVSATIWSLAD